MLNTDSWLELEREEAIEAAIWWGLANAINADLQPRNRIETGLLAVLLDVSTTPPGSGDSEG